jgi:hypothetical protein
MKKINWGKIILYLLVLAGIGGLIAYKSSQSHKREVARNTQSMESERTMQNIREKDQQQEREAEYARQQEEELRQNASNAEYQVNRWYNTYQRLKEEFTGRMNRVMLKQHDDALREAKAELLRWIDIRYEEVVDKKIAAELDGNYDEMESWQQEMERLSRIADQIAEDED